MGTRAIQDNGDQAISSGLTRRTFLKGGAVVVAGAALPLAQVSKAVAAVPAPPLTPFVDPLPVPPVKLPTAPGGTEYDLTIEPTTHSYHSELPAAPAWGYDGIYPGPTFIATRGTPISVQIANNVTAGSHPFAYAFDATIPGNVDDGRVAVHLHGGETAPMSDGNPMDFFLPATSKMYEYANSQRGTTLWYHDHALGNTRLNVMAGLAGFYLLIDPVEEAAIAAANPGAGMPTLPYMMGLAIQDRDFFADGTVDYTATPEPGSGHDHWVPEYFANTACVNGKAMPYLEVEPRRYRFRVLNGAQARFFNLHVWGGPDMYILGGDGGYLPAPVEVTSLLIAPGERYDVVIDFTGMAPGSRFTMTNDAPTTFPEGPLYTDARANTSMKVMQFRVTLPLDTGVPNPPLPATLSPIAPVRVPATARTRSLFLNEVMAPLPADAVARVMLNDTGSADPSTENPRIGSTEVWEVANATGDSHPIHLHLVQFRVIDRRAFAAPQYEAKALSLGYPLSVAGYLTGGPTMWGPTPRPQEAAWKDTVIMNPGEVTRLLVKFAPQDVAGVPGTNSYPFDPTDAPGYVWHCHILEHEENDMMRPLTPVTASAAVASALTIKSSKASVRGLTPFVLSGALTPGHIGDSCVVEVRKPGSARWSYSSNRLTYSMTGAGANWWYRYTPRLRGTYSFRVRFAGDATRDPSLSRTISVKVL